MTVNGWFELIDLDYIVYFSKLAFNVQYDHCTFTCMLKGAKEPYSNRYSGM